MNRRKLLTFIGLSPFVPIAAKAEPGDDDWLNNLIADIKPDDTPNSGWVYGRGGSGPYPGKWTKPKGCERITIEQTAYSWPAADRQMAEFGDVLVCENHRDKAWPEQCNCGPGMRYGDTLRS